MIKNLLSIFALAASLTSIAQTNLGFETWASGNPTGWTTFNQGAAGSTAQVTSGAPQGLSAAKLQTGNCPICPAFGLPGKLPGYIYQAIPFTASITSFDAYIDYNIAANDTAAVVAITSAGGTGNQVAIAGMRFAGVNPGGGWTMMNFPFTTVGAGTVDTLEIAAVSSDSLVLGTASVQNTASVLYIDGIVLNTTTGIVPIAIAEYFAYPNPTAGDFNIVTKNDRASKVEVYDMTGRIVSTVLFADKKAKVNTDNFASGMYIYRIVDANNNDLKTSKFNVTK